MLQARLSNDMKWIIVEGNTDELNNVRLAFTKKIDSWFIIKSKCPDANVDECFMNHLGCIPVGLWIELINTCRMFNYVLTFVDGFNEKIKDCSIPRDAFNNYMDHLFSGSDNLKPRDYQMDGVYNMITYKKCCVEVSTSGGKTLMAYMLFKFMMDYLHLKHILFITPKTELTTQSADKFKLYDSQNGLDSTWTHGEIHSKAKKKDKYDENIIFGNYQSLAKKKSDFFEMFDAVIIDECHHSQARSIRNILKKCVNVSYKFGMTGTFPSSDVADESYKSFVLQSFIGPIVFRLSSHQLINIKKSATPVEVNMFRLKYLDNEKLNALYVIRNVSKKDDPTIGSTILRKEKEMARDNNKRFRYICDLVAKSKHNCLIIFTDKENGYGRKYYDFLRENSPKQCFYIDGDTSPLVRNSMKQAMEDDASGNTVMIASMGCFSEGIDIANVWNILLIETTKSDHTLAQILGRGMRQYEGKEKTMMFDFVDDFSYGMGYYSDNYLLKHGMERLHIYEKRGFPCNIFDIDLRDKVLL